MAIKPDINLLNNGIEWKTLPDWVFVFEIETKKISSFLPEGIKPIEMSPGKSGFAISGVPFPAGTLGKLPPLREILWFILVEPVYSMKMPTPRFCFFIGNASSNNKEFLEHLHKFDKSPVYYSQSLQISIDNYKEIEVSDENGVICSLKGKCEFPNFNKEIIWGQSMTLHESKLYVQAWKYEGSALIYPRKFKLGKVYNHPFFRNIDVSNIGKDGCIQMISNPTNNIPKLTYYEPVVLKEMR